LHTLKSLWGGRRQLLGCAMSSKKNLDSPQPMSAVNEGGDDIEHEEEADTEKDELLRSKSSPAAQKNAPSICPTCVQRRAGLLVAAAGAFTFSLMTVAVRALPLFGPPLPTFLVIVVRGIVVTAISTTSLCRRRVSLLGPRPYWGWLLFRGLCGFTALSCYVRYLPFILYVLWMSLPEHAD